MARTKVDSSLLTPIRGTATNDSAASGYIGEVIESIGAAGPTFPGGGTWSDIVSISLTAGDWEVGGQLGIGIFSSADAKLTANLPIPCS